MAKPRTAHDAALAALIPSEKRGDYELRVQALLARNALLNLLTATLEDQHLTKKALAERAGLEPSSVRRLLTADTANPTTESAFRLLGAMDIKLEAIRPSGERVELV